MRAICVVLLFFAFLISARAQTGPWNNALRMAWSSDGVIFGASTVFQDSSGVPSVIHWKGDTLIAAFQWFREPKPSPSWDRVAVKFSYDNGLTWTEPQPIVVQGMPVNYQRPFDPTLVRLEGDSLRIYFSSSDGLPMGGLDSLVNTYSAVSLDGIHYTFEPDARVDIADRPVIDPAVIYHKNIWHYTAPIGAPQDGAYHFTSIDGLQFVQSPNIPSDNFHNWTGNLLTESDDELRFYGSGPMIWYNSSTDVNSWMGFVATNIKGGDPAIVKTKNEDYLMIFVGAPGITSLDDGALTSTVHIYPNPANRLIHIQTEGTNIIRYDIMNMLGQLVQKGEGTTEEINISALPSGKYVILLYQSDGNIKQLKIIKQE
ncbi:MAG: T9SS type A sorting domain-containing protein [Saprospiraceae bacterium]|nr:T9SS type A sorting domain-containing protein [Saprospiraceae bacterium]